MNLKHEDFLVTRIAETFISMRKGELKFFRGFNVICGKNDNMKI